MDAYIKISLIVNVSSPRPYVLQSYRTREVSSISDIVLGFDGPKLSWGRAPPLNTWLFIPVGFSPQIRWIACSCPHLLFNQPTSCSLPSVHLNPITKVPIGDYRQNCYQTATFHVRKFPIVITNRASANTLTRTFVFFRSHNNVSITRSHNIADNPWAAPKKSWFPSEQYVHLSLQG